MDDEIRSLVNDEMWKESDTQWRDNKYIQNFSQENWGAQATW